MKEKENEGKQKTDNLVVVSNIFISLIAICLLYPLQFLFGMLFTIIHDIIVIAIYYNSNISGKLNVL